jgi:chromosomal replication initiation ATPase DnaA
MCSVNIFEMPLVLTIIQEAEKKIFSVTGKEVKLEGYQPEADHTNPKKELLRKLIVKHTGLTWNEIKSKSRKNEKVNARFIYSWIAVKILRQSTILTGVDLDRDHSTVINALNEVSKSKKDNSQLWFSVEFIIKQFNFENK